MFARRSLFVSSLAGTLMALLVAAAALAGGGPGPFPR